MQEAFSTLDHNKDGKITIEELGVIRDITDTELLNMVYEADVDENGTLDYYEFLIMVKSKAVEQLKAKNVESQVREAFLVLDSDRDGFLTSNDLQRLISSYDESDNMIRQQDIDGDGKIDYEEFALAMS